MASRENLILKKGCKLGKYVAKLDEADILIGILTILKIILFSDTK